jgi:thioredoxin-like negative regulator of GroEL
VKRVHPEFAYQSRELEGQVEGILGDPPNQKNYNMMVQALVGEYASGGGIEDVNMMAFALVDHIRFKDAKGLMAQAAQYDSRKPEAVFGMAECSGEAAKMYEAMTSNYPELARQAIITAFLYKHPRGWVDEDQSLDQLAAGDEGDDDDVEDSMVSEDFTNLFDQEEE